MPERPLSPHLFVYKFKYTLATSIINRFTGLVLSVGLIVLAYWLMSVAGGTREYSQARAVLSMGIFKIFYGALLFAFAYHLVAGVLHLIWDTGRYLERSQSKKSATLVTVVSIVLGLVLVYAVFFASAGHAP